MSHIKETTVYMFDELSETAKEKARDWYRQVSDCDNDWAESVIEDAARLGAIIGIDIHTRPVKLMNGKMRNELKVNWGVACHDAGASVECHYSYRKGGVRELSLEAPTSVERGFESNNEINRIARELYEIQKAHFYGITATSSHGRELTMRVDVGDKDGNETDNDTESAVRTLIRDFASWIHASLEREYEYQSSNEQVDESIRANEYEFTEDGRRA